MTRTALPSSANGPNWIRQQAGTMMTYQGRTSPGLSNTRSFPVPATSSTSVIPQQRPIPQQQPAPRRRVYNGQPISSLILAQHHLNPHNNTHRQEQARLNERQRKHNHQIRHLSPRDYEAWALTENQQEVELWTQIKNGNINAALTDRPNEVWGNPPSSPLNPEATPFTPAPTESSASDAASGPSSVIVELSDSIQGERTPSSASSPSSVVVEPPRSTQGEDTPSSASSSTPYSSSSSTPYSASSPTLSSASSSPLIFADTHLPQLPFDITPSANCYLSDFYHNNCFAAGRMARGAGTHNHRRRQHPLSQSVTHEDPPNPPQLPAHSVQNLMDSDPLPEARPGNAASYSQHAPSQPPHPGPMFNNTPPSYRPFPGGVASMPPQGQHPAPNQVFSQPPPVYGPVQNFVHNNPFPVQYPGPASGPNRPQAQLPASQPECRDRSPAQNPSIDKEAGLPWPTDRPASNGEPGRFPLPNWAKPKPEPFQSIWGKDQIFDPYSTLSFLGLESPTKREATFASSPLPLSSAAFPMAASASWARQNNPSRAEGSRLMRLGIIPGGPSSNNAFNEAVTAQAPKKLLDTEKKLNKIRDRISRSAAKPAHKKDKLDILHRDFRVALVGHNSIELCLIKRTWEDHKRLCRIYGLPQFLSEKSGDEDSLEALNDLRHPCP